MIQTLVIGDPTTYLLTQSDKAKPGEVDQFARYFEMVRSHSKGSFMKVSGEKWYILDPEIYGLEKRKKMSCERLMLYYGAMNSAVLFRL